MFEIQLYLDFNWKVFLSFLTLLQVSGIGGVSQYLDYFKCAHSFILKRSFWIT